MIQPWYGGHVPKSLRNEHGKPHTGGSRFNRGTVVMFPKVYATNTESPTLAVVYSTVVRWSHSRKFTLVAWCRTWYVHELKLHAEEGIKTEKALESEGKEELMKKGKHGLYIATHARQSAREV